MKRTLEFLLIGLLAGGLMTGCPNKKEEETKEEPVPTTAAQEEPKEEEPKEEEPKVEVNQENYLKASYEVACVMAKVEDTEKQKAIKAEIFPRYGFTEESFAEAQTAMAENATVKTALEEKMKECTPEVAMGFMKAEGADAGAAAEAKDGDKPAAKKPAAKAWKAGAYTDASVTGGGFEGGNLRLTVTDEGKVMGSFKGKREGKAFMIPLKGSISKDGSITASGNKGPNNARVTAKYKSDTVAGSVKGAVNQKGFDVGFSAK